MTTQTSILRDLCCDSPLHSLTPGKTQDCHPERQRGDSQRDVNRLRQHAIIGTQWCFRNGEGTVANEDEVYNQLVFTDAVAKELMAAGSYDQFKAALAAGEAISPAVADAVAAAMLEWALSKGATHYTHWFQPLTGRTAEKHDSFFEPKDGTTNRQVPRQGTDPGRARRLLVPERWPARHLRGPRIHRLGPDLSGVHPREPERHHALHPDRVHVVDRRRAGHEDPGAALDARAVGRCRPRAEAVRRRRRRARLHDCRPRAGVLPDPRALLLRAPRPRHDRPHAVRRQAAEGPGARRPLLRLDPRARPRVHDGVRERAGQARRADQDPPQRGRPGAVRGRSDVREQQPRL